MSCDHPFLHDHMHSVGSVGLWFRFSRCMVSESCCFWKLVITPQLFIRCGGLSLSQCSGGYGVKRRNEGILVSEGCSCSLCDMYVCTHHTCTYMCTHTHTHTHTHTIAIGPHFPKFISTVNCWVGLTLCCSYIRMENSSQNWKK